LPLLCQLKLRSNWRWHDQDGRGPTPQEEANDLVSCIYRIC
jgi:hypothetical protein